MIIKRIDSTQRRRANETTSYIMDKEHDGEKLIAANVINCFSQTLDDAQKEMSADEQAYSGPGNAVAHWVVSWQTDENPTAAQATEFVSEFLKDQGMQAHKAAWALHGNTEHIHLHIAVLRVKPEPEPGGGYKLQNFGSRVLRENGTSHEVLSARSTVIDFAKKHGFASDFNEVKKERDADAIKLSQKIEAAEAQNGIKHPKRLIAEQARDIIRAANSFDEMQNNLIKHGISFHIQDNNNPEKYKRWGVLKGPQNERIPLISLPKDCSLKELEKRFSEKGKSFEAPKTVAAQGFYEKKLTANSAKFHARKALNSASSFEEAEKLLSENGMSIERYGKSGAYLVYQSKDGEEKMKLSALGGKYSLSALSKRFNNSSTAYASIMHEKQGKVNALSGKDATTHASAVQSDRATAAAERAEVAGDKAADATAAAVQAGADGMDGFYGLDFFEQIDVMRRVGNAEAAARAATTRMAAAEEKALAMEGRAKAAEMALSMSQHTGNTQPTNKEEKKMEFFDGKKYDYNAARSAAMLACHALAEDKDYGFAAQQLNNVAQALVGLARYPFDIRPGADVSGLLDATSRLYSLCDDVHEQQTVNRAEDKKILDALDKVFEEHRKIAPGASTTIDSNAPKNPVAGFDKAPAETGPKSEKTAKALQEKEIRAPRRKFSFGNFGFGGKGGKGGMGGKTGNEPKM